ncbi:MAG: hypothetical protein WBG18_05810 [Xanthobacteraceae bacterium]
MAEDGSSTQLSPQALALYQRMLEDTSFIKRQQWATTNYAALIYAAIIWFAHNTMIGNDIGCLLFVLSAVTAVIGIVLLVWFQIDLCKLRKRIAGANNYSFGRNEKAGFEIKEADPHPFVRGGHILAILIIVCVAGAVLASITVYPSLKPDQ